MVQVGPLSTMKLAPGNSNSCLSITQPVDTSPRHAVSPALLPWLSLAAAPILGMQNSTRVELFCHSFLSEPDRHHKPHVVVAAGSLATSQDTKALTEPKLCHSLSATK